MTWKLYAFDGTWNDDSRKESWTNIYRLSTCLHPEHGRYYAGVGNWADCNPTMAVLGGAFALGLDDIIRQALNDWRRDVAAGVTTIDVIGFSRGAMAAVDFAGKIREYERDRRVPPAQRMKLRFLGLLDAVDAIGIPDIDWDPFFHKEPPTGKDAFAHAVHAVAIHETRSTFQAVDVPGMQAVTGFIGNHCDIGGGYRQRGLSDITLRWLYDQAKAAGVAWDRSLDHLSPAPDERMPPHRVAAFNYGHSPRRWPRGCRFWTGYKQWPGVDLAAGKQLPHWPLLRQVAVGKGGVLRSKQPGAAIEMRWEFIPKSAFTPD